MIGEIRISFSTKRFYVLVCPQAWITVLGNFRRGSHLHGILWCLKKVTAIVTPTLPENNPFILCRFTKYSALGTYQWRKQSSLSWWSLYDFFLSQSSCLSPQNYFTLLHLLARRAYVLDHHREMTSHQMGNFHYKNFKTTKNQNILQNNNKPHSFHVSSYYIKRFPSDAFPQILPHCDLSLHSN